jgi:hypothetical protein
VLFARERRQLGDERERVQRAGADLEAAPRSALPLRNRGVAAARLKA